MEELNVPTCEQANELIAFLYGELNEVESRSFKSHMSNCSSCSEEFSAFGNIRNSVVAWRNESLGGMTASSATLSAAAAVTGRKTPSALAAWREFFRLSPVWMKGAVAFATLLFCLLAGLAVVRLRSNPPAPLANNSTSPNNSYSDQQLNALVEQRVQDELQRIKNSTSDSPARETVTQRSPGNRLVRRDARVLEMAAISPARRPLTKVEREQLAADLRLVAVNNDSELDLLDDRINQ